MVFMANVQAELKDRINNSVFHLSGAGLPTNGTTGANLAGPGSTYVNKTSGETFVNVGTKASPVWLSLGGMTRVSLTAANVKALRATPATLVAAPGAGAFLEFLAAELFLDYGGTNVFTESTDNLQVRLNDGSGALVSQAIEMTGFIDQSADTITNALAKIDAIVSKANGENKALVLHNTGDGEIAGNAANDNVVRVHTYYRTHLTGF